MLDSPSWKQKSLRKSLKAPNEPEIHAHDEWMETSDHRHAGTVSRVHQGATLLLEVTHDNVHSGNYGTNRITNG